MFFILIFFFDLKFKDHDTRNGLNEPLSNFKLRFSDTHKNKNRKIEIKS